jgi:hypothetical protein
MDFSDDFDADRLDTPPEHGLWCPGDRDPLRVSGI